MNGDELASSFIIPSHTYLSHIILKRSSLIINISHGSSSSQCLSLSPWNSRTFHWKPGFVKLCSLGVHGIWVRHYCGTCLVHCRMLSLVSGFCSWMPLADIPLVVTINKVFRYCQVLYRINGPHLGPLVLWFEHALPKYMFLKAQHCKEVRSNRKFSPIMNRSMLLWGWLGVACYHTS